MKSKGAITLFFILALGIVLGLSLRDEPLFQEEVTILIRETEPSTSVDSVSGCEITFEERTIRGRSLSGLLESGSTVTAAFNYYACNDPEIGDLVFYEFSGNDVPLIKIVKGVSGDSIALQKTEEGWNIVINNDIVTNSLREPYTLTERGRRLLELYVRDYGGVIPKDAVLLLGNQTHGTLDSTRFGLVHKNGLLAKVVE